MPSSLWLSSQRPPTCAKTTAEGSAGAGEASEGVPTASEALRKLKNAVRKLPRELRQCQKRPGSLRTSSGSFRGASDSVRRVVEASARASTPSRAVFSASLVASGASARAVRDPSLASWRGDGALALFRCRCSISPAGQRPGTHANIAEQRSLGRPANTATQADAWRHRLVAGTLLRHDVALYMELFPSRWRRNHPYHRVNLGA